MFGTRSSFETRSSGLSSWLDDIGRLFSGGGREIGRALHRAADSRYARDPWRAGRDLWPSRRGAMFGSGSRFGSGRSRRRSWFGRDDDWGDAVSRWTRDSHPLERVSEAGRGFARSMRSHKSSRSLVGPVAVAAGLGLLAMWAARRD